MGTKVQIINILGNSGLSRTRIAISINQFLLTAGKDILNDNSNSKTPKYNRLVNLSIIVIAKSIIDTGTSEGSFRHLLFFPNRRLAKRAYETAIYFVLGYMSSTVLRVETD